MRFGDQLGSFLKAGQRTAYPLKLVRASEDVRERLVILGNAAHAIHPIGAQGFNLALRDAAVLAEPPLEAWVGAQALKDLGAELLAHREHATSTPQARQRGGGCQGKGKGRGPRTCSSGCPK